MKRDEFFENNKKVFLMIVSLTIVTIAAFFGAISFFGETSTMYYNIINVFSRMFNAFFGALVTSIALIVTLTSNLYTPRLVKIFSSSKLVVFSVFVLLFGNLMILLGSTVANNLMYAKFIAIPMVFIAGLIVASVIPCLFLILQFIRPSFFLPILEKQLLMDLSIVRKNEYSENKVRKIFGAYDVITNVGFTAGKRHDYRLTCRTLRISHDIVMDVISFREFEKDYSWRQKQPVFSRGISEEGKIFLEYSGDWIEAYFLSKTLNLVLENPSLEVVSMFSKNLINSLDLCVEKGYQQLAEYHVMIFNSLWSLAINKKESSLIDEISYHYRLVNEITLSNKDLFDFSFDSYIHYFKQADDGTDKSLILQDILFMLIYTSKEDESKALSLFKYMEENIDKEDIYLSYLSNFHLELESRGLKNISSYLSDNYNVSKLGVESKRVLNREFNNRFVDPNKLSIRAKDFLKNKEKKKTA